MATDVLMPSVEPSMQTGRLTRWLRREGDFVEAGDPIAEIATERATMDVEAPQTGVLTRILVQAGDLEVPVFQQIGLIEPGPAPHLIRAADEPALSEKAGRVLSSPRARRLAHEAGFDLARLKGGGPNGRIVESDVRAALAARLQAANPLLVRAPQGEDGPRLHALMSAAQWTPQVHLEADCRLDALEALREKLNLAAREGRTAKVSLVDCVVKAFALALQRAPRGNVAHAADGFVLAQHSDIALALSVDEKIVAPALPAAEKLALGDIAAARSDFMAGRFSPAAYYGGASSSPISAPLASSASFLSSSRPGPRCWRSARRKSG